MLNANRIVPVQATDLLTLFGVILKMDSNNSTLAKVSASKIGIFEVTSASTPLLCDEPVKHIDLASGVTSATIYFVPDYEYEGFSLAGVETTPTGDVSADGNTLYKAVLSSGTVTITKVGI